MVGIRKNSYRTLTVFSRKGMKHSVSNDFVSDWFFYEWNAQSTAWVIIIYQGEAIFL